MDFLATPDTVTGTAGSATPGTPSRVGLLTDGTSPNDASLNYAKYYNMLLEEMRQIVVAFGGTPNKDNWHQAAIALAAWFAPLASPALTGSPTAPTQSAGDNTTKIASTAFVKAFYDAKYPKIVAAGFFNAPFVGSGVATFNVVTAGLDLTDTKYIIFASLEAQNESYSFGRNNGSFDLTPWDRSGTGRAEYVGDIGWHVIQISA